VRIDPADAIMGVSFFRETAPEDFATFDLSFYAMCAAHLTTV
jgi:hypothetical protein